ncbi:MAG: ATP-binding cassette domain-containing protein [Chloroflexi bacterium]|nr:ATP-binding cassette domain-containing protein [Chloroflexota bacterium]
MENVLIKTVDLKKYFKTPKGLLHAVDGVNITVESGKTLGVVGESGCGKSTLGRLVLRLIEPTSGEVLLKDQNILKYNSREMKKYRLHMQMIFQDPYASLNPRMSVTDIIAEPLIANNLCKNQKEKNEKVKELMDIVGLAQRYSNSYPHELDGGRRQRIGVARALAVDPDFIVCDEPVSALDVSIQAQILNLLMDLQDQQKIAYLFITHDLSVVKHISQTIVIMYLGQCIEEVSNKELFHNPLHPYTQALLSAIPIPDLSSRKHPRYIIKGEVTSPIEPEPGCRFRTRCPHATTSCIGRDIPLFEVEKNHKVACVLFER